MRRIEGSRLNSSTYSIIAKKVAQNVKEMKKQYIEFEKHIKELSSTLKDEAENIIKTQQKILFSSSGERKSLKFYFRTF